MKTPIPLISKAQEMIAMASMTVKKITYRGQMAAIREMAMEMARQIVSNNMSPACEVARMIMSPLPPMKANDWPM